MARSVDAVHWNDSYTALVLGIAGIGGTLTSPQLIARAQRRQARQSDWREVLDAAAVALSRSEARVRDAWRELLGLRGILSDTQLDDILQDPRDAHEFPDRRSEAAMAAVALARTTLDELQDVLWRLTMRLGESQPAAQALSVAREQLSAVVTVMN